jgi:tetratricopeptide (TPR) repeat protein
MYSYLEIEGAVMAKKEKNSTTTVQGARALLDRGVALEGANRTEDAIKVYKEVVANYGASKEVDLAVPVAWALYNMGNAFERLNRPEEALQSYEKSIETYGGRRKKELALPVAQTLFNWGFTLGKLNRPMDEIQMYDEVVNKYEDQKETGLALMVAKALFSKGVALGRMNRMDEAIQSYQQVVERFGDRKEVELAEQVAWALNNKGHALSKLNRLAEAVQTHSEAIERYGDRKETVLASKVAWALVDKGVALNRLNRPQEAVDVYEEANARYGNQKDAEFAAALAQALVNKGNALKRLNLPDESLQSYEEAVKKYGDRNEVKVAVPVANALVNKGVRLVEKNCDAEAVKTCREVLERYGNRQEAEFATPLVEALMNLHAVLRKMNRSGEAAEIFTEVISKFDHPDESGTIGPAAPAQLAHVPVNLTRWAEDCLKRPNPSDGAELAFLLTQTALSFVTPGSVLYPKLRHFHAMAMRFRSGTGPDTAGVFLQAAEIDREAWKLSLNKAPQEAVLFAMQWGDWAWEKELWEEASEAYSNAHQALRFLTMRHTTDRPGLLTPHDHPWLSKNISSRIAVQEYARFATRGAYSLSKLKKLKDAVLLLEYSNGLLFTTNATKAEQKRLERNLPDLHEKYKAVILAASEAHQKYHFDPFGNLSPEETSAIAEMNSIVNEIRKKPGFESFATLTQWGDVQEASALIPLVYVAPTDKGCVCFVVKTAGNSDTKGVIVDSAVTVQEMAGAAQPFFDAQYGKSGDDKGPPLYNLLKWLGERIMMSVRLVLDNMGHSEQPFVIMPFGFAALLPLHAALIQLDNPVRIHHLFHPKNVSYAYSARSLIESLKRKAESPKPPALVINNPMPLPDSFESLVLASSQASAVRQHFSGVTITGEKATLDKICELLPTAGVAHFCCHGTVEPRLNYSGVLLLASQKELTYLHLLYSMDQLSARLVALAACSSGRSDLKLEHTISLPAAFLSAGAAGVIGTFWPTDEVATFLLFQKFYELWKGPRSPLEALGVALTWLATSTADTLRASMPSQALKSPAAQRLREAPAQECFFGQPWNWAGFFLAGA